MYHEELWGELESAFACVGPCVTCAAVGPALRPRQIRSRRWAIARVVRVTTATADATPVPRYTGTLTARHGFGWSQSADTATSVAEGTSGGVLRGSTRRVTTGNLAPLLTLVCNEVRSHRSYQEQSPSSFEKETYRQRLQRVKQKSTHACLVRMLNLGPRGTEPISWRVHASLTCRVRSQGAQAGASGAKSSQVN